MTRPPDDPAAMKRERDASASRRLRFDLACDSSEARRTYRLSAKTFLPRLLGLPSHESTPGTSTSLRESFHRRTCISSFSFGCPRLLFDRLVSRRQANPHWNRIETPMPFSVARVYNTRWKHRSMVEAIYG